MQEECNDDRSKDLDSFRFATVCVTTRLAFVPRRTLSVAPSRQHGQKSAVLLMRHSSSPPPFGPQHPHRPAANSDAP